MANIITIHQPNFFPFNGIIQKVLHANILVILGNCQYECSNYQNRFKYKDDWYTMSVNHKIELIKEKIYLSPEKDWNKIKVKLKEFKYILDQFDEDISNNLLETNTKIIKRICKILNIGTKIEPDYPTTFTKTERLVNICKTFNATHYLSGPSGKKYLDLELFKKENIKVIFQDQSNIPKVSILEYIKNREMINEY